MQIKDVEKLKAWLLKRLSPLCDADPSALSKYIVALLRKEKPRAALKELCINQLEVFLSKETPSFVDRLFLSLDTESYLSGSMENSPSPPPTTHSSKALSINRSGSEGGGIKVSSSDRIVTIDHHRRTTDDSRHREVDEDDRDFRRAKGRHDSPSLGGGGEQTTIVTTGGSNESRGQRKRRGGEVDPPKRSIRQRLGPKEDDYRNNRRLHVRRRSKSRSRSRSRSSTPEFVSSQDEESGNSSNRKRSHNDQQTRQIASKRQRCKDYDEKGMCLLGEQCPFDHGVDPVVITGPIPPPYPPPPHFPMGMPPPPPPHNLPNTTNGLMLQSAVIPPPPPPMTVSTTSVDGYNPEEPSLNAPSKVLAPPPPPMHPSMMTMRPTFPSMPGMPGMNVPPPLPPAIPPSTHLPAGEQPGMATSNTAPKLSVGSMKIPFRLSDTLVLRKIPRELNTITKLSGHFEKFGTIVNLQVRYENDPESAIVQFTNPQEAKKAHDSTEAVLNNRFIKVYYLKNTGGPTFTPGQKENFLKTSTPVEISVQMIRPDTLDTATVNSTATPSTSQAPPTQPNSSSYTAPNKSQQEDQQHRRHLSVHMKKQLAKQEALNTAAQKRMELQKKSQSLLEAQIKQQKLLLSKLEKSGSTLTAEEKAKVLETLKSLSSSVAKLKETISSASKIAQMKPLPPIHIPHSPVVGNTVPKHSPHPSPDANHTLQQKADQLRSEARKLGILPTKGGVGGSNVSMDISEDGGDLRNKLESKPRQLLVINSVTDKDLLVKYFESFGGLNQVELDPDCGQNLIFTFRNRNVAEKAVQGSIFKGKPLIMKWYTPKPKSSIVVSEQQQEKEPPSITRTVVIENNVLDDKHEDQETKKQLTRPISLSNELDLEGLLEGGPDDDVIDVVTPNQSKPRVVHLLDDDDEDDDRSWRR